MCSYNYFVPCVFAESRFYVCCQCLYLIMWWRPYIPIPPNWWSVENIRHLLTGRVLEKIKSTLENQCFHFSNIFQIDFSEKYELNLAIYLSLRTFSQLTFISINKTQFPVQINKLFYHHSIKRSHHTTCRWFTYCPMY